MVPQRGELGGQGSAQRSPSLASPAGQHVLLGLHFQELSWDHTAPEEDESVLWLEFDGNNEGTLVNKLLKVYSKQVMGCHLPLRVVKARSWGPRQLVLARSGHPVLCTPPAASPVASALPHPVHREVCPPALTQPDQALLETPPLSSAVAPLTSGLAPIFLAGPPFPGLSKAFPPCPTDHKVFLAALSTQPSPSLC